MRRFRMRTGERDLDASNVGYIGSQPSILRKCLLLLPELDGATFIDLGCGKGRMLAVATEFPFRAILGIELVRDICEVAKRNASILAARHTKRSQFQVLNGDATEPPLPSTGLVVLFLYNPFHGDVVDRLIGKLNEAISTRPGLKIFVIYYNPVHANRFDATSLLQRFHAARYTFANEELRSSPFGNDHDSVVIWQSCSGEIHPPLPGADDEVRVVIPDIAAEVERRA